MAISDSNNTSSNDNTIVVLTDEITGRNASIITDTDGIDKLQVKSTAVPQPIGNLFFGQAVNGGSVDMSVDGTTPVEFMIGADATKSIVIESLTFESFASGIKIDKFLSLNSELTNGIVVEVKSQDTVFQFVPIKNTNEFDAHFSHGPGRSFRITYASGNDAMVARFSPRNPFIIKKQGTYATDDYIKVIVQDNISQVGYLAFLAFGAFDV